MTQQANASATTNFSLCGYDEIENRSAKAIALQGVNADGAIETCPLVLVRWDEQVYGYINTCPHTPVKLDGGTSGEFFNPERSHLMCDKHGAIFEVDTGLCLDGPCQGKGLTPLSVEVIDGSICLTNVRTVQTDDDR